MKPTHALLPIAIVSVIFFAGCEESGTDTPIKFIPAPPSNPMALSLNETTVRLKWSASPSNANPAFRGYRIDVSSGSQTFNPIRVGKDALIVDIAGLNPGQKYTFTVRATTDDTISTPISIEWAGARRFRGIRAYETASANGSGIRLSDGSNLTIANGTQWDVCLDTRQVGGQDNWAFGSPQASTYTDDEGRFIRGAQAGQRAKVTIVFSDSTQQGFIPSTNVADSLEAVFESAALGTGKKTVQIMVENLQNASRSIIFYAKTQEGNFAKILLKASNGMILQGASPNRYVEIDYSFQSAANVPYALAKGVMPNEDPRIIKIGTQSLR